MNKNTFIMTVRGCGSAYDVENMQFTTWKQAYDSAIAIINQFRGSSSEKSSLTKWQGSGLTALWRGVGIDGEERLVHIDPHHDSIPNPLAAASPILVHTTNNKPPLSEATPSAPETTLLPVSSSADVAIDASALIFAICNGDASTVRSLLDKGANPNSVDEDGDAPLTEAVWWGHRDIVQLLLNAEANHNVKNGEGETAMEIAVSKGNMEMVMLLQSVAKERILKPKRSVLPENNPKLETLLKELKAMVGLNLVKAHIESQRHRLRLQNLKEKEGLPVTPQILHLVFTGNPGTGKTTIARLIAEIYQAMGILSIGQLIEVTAKDLIGEHVGQTEAKTTKAIDDALGGVLFIDEAYALLNIPYFGKNAINTLVPALSEYSDDLMVIVAGYPEPMRELISSDPGLKRRFPVTIEFEDFLPDELSQVFFKRASEDRLVMADGVSQKVMSVFEDLYRMRGADFGNAGVAINLFDKAISNQSSRLAQMSSVDKESLMTLRPEDIPSS